MRGRIGLRLVAAFKFLKAFTLVGVGLGSLGMLDPRWNDAAHEWLKDLALNQGQGVAVALSEHILASVGAASPRQLLVAAAGAFLYAAVFLVEGVGLWRYQRWAEYLTVLVTASFLPVEILSLHHWPLAGALLLNCLAIAYLVWQLWVTRGAYVPARQDSHRVESYDARPRLL